MGAMGMGALGRRLKTQRAQSHRAESLEQTSHGHARLRRRIRQLEIQAAKRDKQLAARIAEIEEGLQEQRGLSQRVAELADLVAELIGAAARGDKVEFEAALAKYSDGL